VNYAEKVRKDFLVILDPIRNIFVQGQNSKVINTKKLWSPNAGIDPDPQAAGYNTTNFSQHIYWPLRHQFATTNCSYATTYATWAQVLDPQSNRQIWIPFSGFACAAMANTDSNFQPWYAPAGFTRGVLVGVNDLAIYPKQKQRDQLYKISLNPVAFFPNEGFVIFGQKTLLKKPSAFDRINVRRLFLNLERATKETCKFFVFEPNTLFTRTQVVNILSPIFENAKNTEGLYDYRIVCSELNNTPDVIDNNQLNIDIDIQPVRAAEFILVNFYATRTGTNFDEIIGA
jgi:phage tail sheath protein FI